MVELNHCTFFAEKAELTCVKMARAWISKGIFTVAIILIVFANCVEMKGKRDRKSRRNRDHIVSIKTFLAMFIILNR